MGRWEENGEENGEAGVERWKSMGFHGISDGKLCFFSHDGNPWEFSMGRVTSGWDRSK